MFCFDFIPSGVDQSTLSQDKLRYFWWRKHAPDMPADLVAAAADAAMSEMLGPNPVPIQPVHCEMGAGESFESWTDWKALHAADYAEADRRFCLHNDVLLHRSQDHANSKPAGYPVGSDENGYLASRLKGRPVKVHHLVWLLTYSHWPRHPLVLDHINMVRNDNRIANLREVTHQWNCLLGKRAKSKSELPYGVSIRTMRGVNTPYALATIMDKTGKHHNHHIPINDPSKREAAIAESAAWWLTKHQEFHPRREDYAPGDLI